MNLPPYSVRITLSLTEALSMSHLRSNVTNTRSSQRAYLCLAGAGYSRHQRQRQSYAQCLHAQQASNKLSPSTDTAQRRLRQLTIRTRLSDQTYQIVADGTSRFNSQWLRPKGWRSAELVCGCRSMSNLVEPSLRSVTDSGEDRRASLKTPTSSIVTRILPIHPFVA